MVTTHFMEEAEYCDRVAIMDAGRVLAQGTPAEIRAARALDQGDASRPWKTHLSPSWRRPAQTRRSDAPQRGGAHDVRNRATAALWHRPKLHRVGSLIRKETRQIVRDPSSIAIGIVLPVMLILLFGYGLSLDVTDVPVAVVLEDPSPAATELAASFQLSPLFRRPVDDFDAARHRNSCCRARSTASCASGRIFPAL